jgi:hypothetical protein
VERGRGVNQMAARAVFCSSDVARGGAAYALCYPACMDRLFHPWRVCVHESGHAVAGLATGRTITTARVGNEPHVAFESADPSEASALDLARCRLMVHVAGVVAEDLGVDCRAFLEPAGSLPEPKRGWPPKARSEAVEPVPKRPRGRPQRSAL